MVPICLFAYVLTCVIHLSHCQYVVTLQRTNGHYEPGAQSSCLFPQPVLNSQLGQSVFDFNYNPSYIPLFNPPRDALLVRCQNAYKNGTLGVGPSVVGLAVANQSLSASNNIYFHNISTGQVVFRPTTAFENYGTEDPRVAYRAKDQTYYMFYTAAQEYPNRTIIARLALATTKNPSDPFAWKRRPQPIFMQWSKSGALLLRDDHPGSLHYLIWGDSNLTMATTTDLQTFTNLQGFFITTRPNMFDSHLVESGPPPLHLTDGNYLFFYNSARKGFPSPKVGYSLQYNVGWVILNGTDPTKIIQRSSAPLLSPQMPWEIGQRPYLGLVPRVTFLEGAKSLGNNQFLVFYGAADSVVGSAIVSVAKTVPKTTTSHPTTATVSVAKTVANTTTPHLTTVSTTKSAGGYIDQLRSHVLVCMFILSVVQIP